MISQIIPKIDSLLISMYETEQDLSRYRQRIIDEAVRRFKGDNIFPGDEAVLATCEGLMDLLMEPRESRDPHVVMRFMEWVYNIIRRQGHKTDRTIEFLDMFESIVKRPLTNKEDKDIEAFFEMCREIVRNRHKELERKPP